MFAIGAGAGSGGGANPPFGAGEAADGGLTGVGTVLIVSAGVAGITAAGAVVVSGCATVGGSAVLAASEPVDGTKTNDGCSVVEGTKTKVGCSVADGDAGNIAG